MMMTRPGRPATKVADFVATIRHPCFSEAMHSRVGRIHLPVARRCNIHCRYCERRVGEFYHSSRPGIAYRLIGPAEVKSYIENALKVCPGIEVVAVAGPGEPLFNPETFESLRIARKRFPKMKLCVCTNGLLLPDRLGALERLGVRYLTVTINAATPETAARVYAWVRYKGRLQRGVSGAKLLVNNQFEGLGMAAAAGMDVKVNSVLVPGINDNELPMIAERAAALGAGVMNIMPLIPSGEFSGRKAPGCGRLRAARKRCEGKIPQFRLCKQCRADACGVPGEGDMKLTVKQRKGGV
jgi:nitrogen fixation protein NifB